MCEIKNLNDLKSRILENYNDVEISENKLENGGYLVILRGGLQSNNPKAYMDAVVSEYVRHTMYNEFVEIFMDNPWVRVLIFNFNEINNWERIDTNRSIKNECR